MKELTQNQLINKYLSMGAQLDDELDDESDGEFELSSILIHEYDCGRLSYNELKSVLYEVFHIDKNFSTYSEITMNQLASLGFEIDQILNSDFEAPQLRLARQYCCLDMLKDSEHSLVAAAANKRIYTMNRINESSKPIKNLFYALTHRECKFWYVDSHSCELWVPKGYYWTYGDEGIIFKITENNNEYDVYAEIHSPIPESFDKSNTVYDDLSKYKFNFDYDRDEDIMYMSRSQMSLNDLTRFMKWIGLEIDYAFVF